MNVTSLILAMVWILSGLSVVFFMMATDKSKSENYSGVNWIRGRDFQLVNIIILVAFAPLTLALGILVLWDYCQKD